MRLAPALLVSPPLLLACGAALAQPVRVQPTRDVVVLYRVDGPAAERVPGGLPNPVKLSWDAAGQRVRAETQGRSQIALLDLRARTGQAIDTTLRVVLPLPVRPQDLQPLTLEGARLTPRGRETIAGLTCTTYQVETGRTPASACITADGVPLRGQGDVDGRPGSFVALSVSYGPLPPSLFAPPPGYIALASPGGGGLGDLRSLGRSLLGHGN